MYEPDDMQHFTLADWTVNTATNRLQQGDTEVKLESKVMAVLHVLAQHPNEPITREALEQAIWGNTIVGYDALTRCIAQLRKALGDDKRAPRYIETISKKGYRLIAPVSVLDSAQATPTLNTQTKPPRISQARFFWIVGATISLAVVVIVSIFLPSDPAPDLTIEEPTPAQIYKQPSIAILPFINTGNDPAHRYFSDGVTADITTALSKLSGLLVISNASARTYPEQSPDIKQVASSLGVRYLLTGSVRHTQARIRVNVNLIDSSNAIVLWSEQYDRELRSVFDVQDDITDNIIQALSVELTEAEKQRTAHRYTNSIEAYDDFLKGQALYVRHNREDNRQAKEYFQRAIDRDAGFARAWSAMALTQVAERRYGWTNQPEQTMDLALQLASKGIALDPELPQAYWVLGYVHVFRREYAKATIAAERSIALDPNYADSYLTLAVCRLHEGAPAKALALTRKAMLLNPAYPAAYASILGQSYFFNSQYDQAISTLNEAIARNNNLLTAHVFLIAALSKQERFDDAKWAAIQLKSTSIYFSADEVGKMLAINDTDLVEEIKQHLRRAGL